MHPKAYIQAIADALAAEVIGKAMLLIAQHSVRGERLSRIDAINLALVAMAEEMEWNDNDAQ